MSRKLSDEFDFSSNDIFDILSEECDNDDDDINDDGQQYERPVSRMQFYSPSDSDSECLSSSPETVIMNDVIDDDNQGEEQFFWKRTERLI